MVLQALLDRLAAARRAGTTFADAWPDALETALRAAAGKRDRAEWSRALAETAVTWQEAYERRAPQRSEWCLHALPDLDGETVLAEHEPRVVHATTMLSSVASATLE